MEIVPEIVIEETEAAPETPKNPEITKTEEEDVRPGDEPLRKNVPALVKDSKAGIIAGWVILLVLLIGGGFSLYFFRDYISSESSMAKQFYQKWDALYSPKIQQEPKTLPPKIVTEPHPASFLTMRQSAVINFENDVPNLVIILDIQNSGTEDVTLPDLEGVIRDGEGNELFNWTQNLDPKVVPAGGFRQYEIYVDSIQTASREAEVSFNWDDQD